GILSIFFFQFTKRKLVEWGKLRQDLDSRISKISLEGFGGIKDILILGKRSYFTNQYSQDNFLKARVASNQNTVSQIPRFYLEFISILGLISFIVMLLWQQKAIISIIAILGVFVAATFRMIPSLNKVIAALQTLKFYRSSLDVIHTEIMGVLDIKNEIKKSNDVWNFNSTIELKNIHFSYGENNILEEIDLTIYKGQTIGIIGESGSGKSTLVDLIIGLHLPTSGEIFIDGISGFQMQQIWRSKIGYISQTIFLTDDTIANNIAFGVEKKCINFDLINELLKQVQLDKFVNNLENGLDTRVGERGVQLSGGQRQRIGIARALYNNPEILILDEATSSLDTFTETQVLNSIKNLKGEKTILMIAHRLTTLVDCDMIYEVKNNKLDLTKI
ncbi:ABC transporter ATP-binding protein/permease, partial [Flavobacteriaceae bacterium]|nr:ABC transporter ATP-binding protein/permease [Flavobacteriaceae bacterium]